MTKVQSHVMLILLNVTIESSNLRKKIKEPLYMTKELSNMGEKIRVLPNVTIV